MSGSLRACLDVHLKSLARATGAAAGVSLAARRGSERSEREQRGRERKTRRVPDLGLSRMLRA